MGKLLLTISQIIYGFVLRAMRVTKLPARAATRAMQASKKLGVRFWATIAGLGTALSDEISAVKKSIADETRVYAAKWAAFKANDNITESELYELEQEVRREKLGLITTMKLAATSRLRSAFDKAERDFGAFVDNAELPELQAMAQEYGFSPPTELSSSAKSQLKGAFKSWAGAVKSKGRDEIQLAINDAASRAKRAEEIALERMAKAKEAASVNTRLLTTGLSIPQIAQLRGRSTAQIQSMLQNLKEGDGRSEKWTRKQLESVLKIREEQQARRSQNAQ